MTCVNVNTLIFYGPDFLHYLESNQTSVHPVCSQKTP